jgi:hypothetical protein
MAAAAPLLLSSTDQASNLHQCDFREEALVLDGGELTRHLLGAAD